MRITAIPSLFASMIFLAASAHAMPLDPPCCDSGDPLVICSRVCFSYLDGSSFDLDGVANGELEVDGLIVKGWGKIVIDTCSASILSHGMVLLKQGGSIDNDVWPLPCTGPSICISTCSSIVLQDYARIRSQGSFEGGSIHLSCEEDFCMTGFSNIDCRVFDEPHCSVGGNVCVQAGGKINIASIMSFITVQANFAGSVYLVSCDSCSDAVSIRGRVLAQGTGSDGIGGEIKVKADNGGIFLPGVNNCLATGQHCNGHICLEYYSVIGPNCPPIVLPAPYVHQIL